MASGHNLKPRVVGECPQNHIFYLEINYVEQKWLSQNFDWIGFWE
jgi:hypothetical protein